MIPRDKVLSVLERFDSIEKKMAETAASDTIRMTALGRDRKKLEPVLQVAKEWLSVSKELESLAEKSRDSDK